jgi:hydrogenase/urease accessory protein HupE
MNKIPDTTLYTIVQLVMGAEMGIVGFALIFGVTVFLQVPINVWVAVCMLCIAALFLRDALIQWMSAMSMNVEPEELPGVDDGTQ